MPDLETQKSIVQIAVAYFQAMMAAGSTGFRHLKLEAVTRDTITGNWLVTVSYVENTADDDDLEPIYERNRRYFMRVTVVKDLASNNFLAAGMSNLELPSRRYEME